MSFESTIRAKWIMDGAKTLEEAASQLESYAAELRQMAANGVTLDGPVADDYGTVITEDQAVASQYQFAEMSYED